MPSLISESVSPTPTTTNWGAKPTLPTPSNPLSNIGAPVGASFGGVILLAALFSIVYRCGYRRTRLPPRPTTVVSPNSKPLPIYRQMTLSLFSGNLLRGQYTANWIQTAPAPLRQYQPTNVPMGAIRPPITMPMPMVQPSQVTIAPAPTPLPNPRSVPTVRPAHLRAMASPSIASSPSMMQYDEARRRASVVVVRYGGEGANRSHSQVHSDAPPPYQELP